MLRNPRLLFALFALGVVIAFGAAWLPKGPGTRELFLPLAKAADFERGCLSVHGPVWWTPNYLQGQSWAGFWSTPLSVAALEAGRLLLFPLTTITAYKVVALLSLFLAGWAMYGFVLELSGSAWTAAAAGIFYLLCPEPSNRLGLEEHLAFGGAGLCFAFPPLICLTLLRLQRAARDRNVHASRLALSLSLGAFFLMATKMAVLSLPLFCIYALWLRNDLPEPSDRARFFAAAFLGGLWGGLLGGIPLLPLLREEKWMTLFSTDPLHFWQATYTIKSVISWWDRDGFLLRHAPQIVCAAAGSFYIGGLWSLVLGGALLGIGPWKGWGQTARGRLCSLFLSLTLFFTWLSYGIRPPFIAHIQILYLVHPLSHLLAILFWLALVAEAAAVYRLTKAWHPHRLVPILATSIFLLVPGFSLLSPFPPFNQVRAPASFWILNGSFCMAVAGALALRCAVEKLAPKKTLLRGAILAVVAFALWIDFAPYHAAFRKGGLPPAVYADYLKAAAFLREQPWGYVQPYSERCFDLTLPQLANKPLTYEAPTSYFQPRWIRPYQDLSRMKDDALIPLLTASGVRYILLDQSSPVYGDSEIAAFLKKNRPVLYQNPSFLIFGAPSNTTPALATGRILTPPSTTARTEILQSVALDLWPIKAVPPNPKPAPGVSQKPSRTLPLAHPRLSDYHTITVASTPPGQPWVIVPESYHPDWHAVSDGRPVPVYQALGCLLAARAAQDGAGVTFHFEPPWWYNGCLILAACAWIVSLCAWMRKLM